MIREAADGDAAALAALLLRNPQEGRMVLGQDRRHDVFARRRAFADAVTLVIDGDDGPAGAVTVATKRVVVAGRPTTAAYVFDLAVDRPARGRRLAAELLDAAVDWAGERGAALVYANIMGGNERSHAVFRRAGFDRRIPMALRIFPVFRSRPAPVGPPPDPVAAAARIAEVARTHDLAPAVAEDELARRWENLPGWDPAGAWTTDRATLVLWDHRAVSHPVPLRLPPELRALSAVSRAASRLRVPFPGPVEVGEPIAVGYVLDPAGDDVALQGLLLRALGRAQEIGLDEVIVGHQAGRRPAWARGAWSVGEGYDIVTRGVGRPLDARLGERPVHADLVDL